MIQLRKNWWFLTILCILLHIFYNIQNLKLSIQQVKKEGMRLTSHKLFLIIYSFPVSTFTRLLFPWILSLSQPTNLAFFRVL